MTCRPATRRGDDGAVAAETAVVLPLIALFTLTMVWLICLGLTQVRTLDAARETARAAARSEGLDEARSLGRRVAPAGSSIAIDLSGGAVVVRVSSPVRGPAGLIGRLTGVRVRAEAVAAQEPAS